jgi:hypothetical protein
MKMPMPCLLGCCLALALLASEPLGAAPAGLRPAAQKPTDVSTARRKHHAVSHRNAAGSPSQIYGAQRTWHGADPSWGPGTPQLRAYQREGRCVIDEGYGRYTFCDNY